MSHITGENFLLVKRPEEAQAQRMNIFKKNALAFDIISWFSLSSIRYFQKKAVYVGGTKKRKHSAFLSTLVLI